MNIHRDRVLEFYDKRCPWPPVTGSPVSAITGVIGEDLVLGLLCRRLNGKILSYGCKPEGSSGRRLDAWVSAGGKLYQVEVKNWCAHSLGGETVPDDTIGIRQVSEKNLEVFLTHPRNLEAIWKILGPMKPPTPLEYTEIIPLLALWAPVALSSQDPDLPPYWFDCDLANYKEVIPAQYREVTHKKIQIFSASLYLRSLRSKVIRLSMPRTKERIRQLERLFDQ